MPEKRTLADRIGNRLFAIPAVAQLWASLIARRTDRSESAAIPFAPLAKPLHECRVALVTTGGVHLQDQQPFDMDDPDGDASFREIPADVDPARLMITHKYYDHRDADRDLNSIFPLDHLRDLVARRVLGELASCHFGFMGHIQGTHLPTLIRETAPEIAARLRADEVDCALLTPA